MFTLLGLTVALLIFYIDSISLSSTGIIIPLSGALLLFLACASVRHRLQLIQKIERDSLPGIAAAYRSCKYSKAIDFAIVTIAFLSLIAGLVDFDSATLFWIPLYGIGLDLLLWQQRQNLYLLDPFWIVEHQKGDLVDQMDNLSSCAAIAISKGNLALARGAVTAMQSQLVNQLGETEPASRGYLVTYCIKRLHYLAELSKKYLMSPLDYFLLKTLGKNAVGVGRIDPELATLCLHELSRLSKEAQDAGQEERVTQATFVAVQSAAALLDETEEENLQYPLRVIIAQLEETAKETFQMDKDTDLTLLTQPIDDLQAIFESPAHNKRSDVLAAGQDLIRVQSDFAALKEIMLHKREED